MIALDGPPGSGKGTAARKLAARFGLRLVDSGALYRLVAYKAIQTGTSLDEVDVLVGFACANKPRFTWGGGVWLQKQDLYPRLRSVDVETLTPKVGAIPQVRAAILKTLQSYREKPGLVTDGRDQYDVFSRDSEVHRLHTFGFYITAEVEARAAHRSIENGDKNVDVKSVRDALIARDEADRRRPNSPFVQHPDAVVVDTTSMTPQQVVELIANKYNEMRRQRGL